MSANNRRLFKNHSACGLTLIEFLMALASTLFLLLALTVMLLALEKNFNTEDALNSIQENARSAIGILQINIHQAGSIGCAKLQADVEVKSFAAYTLTSKNKLLGTEHEITVRNTGVNSAGLTRVMTDRKIIYVSAKPVFQAGDLAIIADCETAEIIAVKNSEVAGADAQRIESVQPLTKNYNQTASISNFEINTFLVEQTGREDGRGAAITALYVKNRHGRKTELVEDVDDLELTYDVKKNHRLLTVTAEQVADWAMVAGVNVNFQVKHFPYKKHWNTYIAL